MVCNDERCITLSLNCINSIQLFRMYFFFLTFILWVVDIFLPAAGGSKSSQSRGSKRQEAALTLHPHPRQTMTLAQVGTNTLRYSAVQWRAWEIANGNSCTVGGSAGSGLGPGEKWGTAVARGGDSATRSRPHHRSGPLSSDKSRGPRFKAGAVVRGRRHSF